MPVVYPVVRWISYPRIGVEFEGIDEKDRELIFRLMFAKERQMVRMDKVRSAEDRLSVEGNFLLENEFLVGD